MIIVLKTQKTAGTGVSINIYHCHNLIHPQTQFSQIINYMKYQLDPKHLWDGSKFQMKSRQI